MDHRLAIIIVGFSFLAFARCGQSVHPVTQALSPLYEQVQTISSNADCLGPDGGYLTNVTEADNGHLLFEQSFTYKSDDFRVRIEQDSIGYLLDSLDQTLDTLTASVAWIIRSHHFHKMAAQPLDFFQAAEKEAEQTDPQGEWYTGKDPNGNGVRFRIYPIKQRLERMEVLNPDNPDEVISITYHSFLQTVYGPMAQRVDIKQGNEATYIFQFKSIVVNGEEMLVG
ncbi:MAG: hypothetical protein AAF598_07660 [Bacteroidota bacterium]